VSTEPDSWRFLDTGANDGAFNMALDEVLANVAPGPRPVFRVYRWRPPTISLGYHQNLAEVDLEKCRADGIGVVRRPTGGRAILHAQEVTYSVILPKTHELFSAGTTEVYRLISAALVRGLSLLSPQIVLERSARGSDDFAVYNEKFACFATSARHEILLDSRKLVGSAQRRFENGLLQHGSIMTGAGHLRLTDYLARENRDGREQAALLSKTASLSDALGREPAFSETVKCLKKGIETAFQIRLEKDELTDLELETVLEHKLTLKIRGGEQ